MIGMLLATANFLIAGGLLVQCFVSLNRIDDDWMRIALHLFIAMAAGLLAFRGADLFVDIANSDRTAIGRLLLNMALIPAWILIHRVSQRRG